MAGPPQHSDASRAVPTGTGRRHPGCTIATDAGAPAGEEYERIYGHRAEPEEPGVLVNMVLVLEGLPDAPVVPDTLHLDRAENGAGGGGSRNAYFGPEAG